LRRLLDDAVKTAHDREPAEERRRRAAPEADAGIATHTPPGADLNSATVLSNPSLLRIQRLAGNNAVLRLMLNEAQRRERRGGTGKEGDRSDADHAADGVIELDEDQKNPKEQAREKQQHHQEMKEASPGAKVPRPPPTAKPTSGDGGTSTTA
jgi:hypothetical protein